MELQNQKTSIFTYEEEDTEDDDEKENEEDFDGIQIAATSSTITDAVSIGSSNALKTNNKVKIMSLTDFLENGSTTTTSGTPRKGINKSRDQPLKQTKRK